MGRKFTDIFIERPVMATVLSLLILVLGLHAIFSLPVREYPQMSSTIITVQTVYPGASADLVESFITSQLETQLGTTQGLDYMTSQSIDGFSTITLYLKLNYDPTTAFTDVMSEVGQVQYLMPEESEQPIIKQESNETVSLMYITYNSEDMTSEQITNYITRVVQPKLETVDGVAQAEILGSQMFAMRIWLNLDKMAAFGVTPKTVAQALAANNYQSAAGKTKGKYVQMSISATTGLSTPEEFRNIVIKKTEDSLVHISDVARVELGSQSYDSSVYYGGKAAVFIAINPTSTANPLTVVAGIKKVMPALEKMYPSSLHSKVVYDSTEYIQASLDEVNMTLVEAACIVILVIFLFLGSFRAVLIPVVTIPLSLIGVCMLMQFLGYSINLLTLLAMILAIGLVVDDAIVVVENAHRHIQLGANPMRAAILGAREIATPVISMTITLAAVYAPIGFMGGLTGSLFTEFAFTLAMSVIISGFVALTLSPMMCSRFLTASLSEGRYVQWTDKKMERLKNWYQSKLESILADRTAVVIVAAVVLPSCFFLYTNTFSELSPTEDQGVLFVTGTAPDYANIDYVEKFTNAYNTIYKSFSSVAQYFTVNGYQNQTNGIISAMIMKPWNQRTQTQDQAQKLLQNKMRTVSGLQSIVFPLPSLPGGSSGLPVQFVISTAMPMPQLYEMSQRILKQAQDSGMLTYVTSMLRYDMPKLHLNIDRPLAFDLGFNMQDIGQVLAAAFGGNYINLFASNQNSYQVIPQVERHFRYNPKDLDQIYVPTLQGDMIPLSTFISISQDAQPNALTHFNQLNSASIQGVIAPSYSMGAVLKFLQNAADKTLTPQYTYNYAGQSRQYIVEGGALMITFFLSIIIIYLVLAAQFESFKDPFIVLISVPMSICGALIPLNLGLATINIYTQIGLITLVGLISKHGILIVEFANDLQENEGYSLREAIVESAAVRMRPILMTTAAMVLGVIPLLIASGAGAISRFDIGLVIASGMTIGTLFTLFVVPTMYTFFGHERQKKSSSGTESHDMAPQDTP